MLEIAVTAQIAEANKCAHLERSKAFCSIFRRLRRVFSVPLSRTPALTGLSR